MNLENLSYHDVLDQLAEGVYLVDPQRRIIFWNRGAQRITGYPAAEVLGRPCSDNLLVHVDECGRGLCRDLCPLAASIHDGRARCTHMFVHHKDGHRVPVRVHTTPLRDPDGRTVGGVEVFSDDSARVADLQRIQQLEHMAFLDPLTGLANRRFIQAALDARLAEHDRYGWTFGLAIFDVDHFKAVNDRHGHHAGDRVLQMIARTFRHNIRAFDSVGRWGGEEFLLLMSAVNLESLRRAADSLRALVEQSALYVGTITLAATVSAGATVLRPGDNAASLLKRADALLYESKSAGRNRVTAAP